MYRLLIVDDESHVVDWLYELFRETEPIEFDVYRAYSASAALLLMEKAKIDIVVTDINMPKMNGLQLVEKIKAEWPECRVIFLTGYNEFEYAHKAIQNDAVGYVLKTDADEELVKAVEKAVRQIEDSRKLAEVALKAKQQIKTALSLIQRDFLNRILDISENKVEELQKQMNELEIPLNAGYPVLFLLGRIDNKSKIHSYMERSELLYGVDSVCSRFLSTTVSSFFLIRDGYNIVWFIQPSNLASKSGATGPEEGIFDKAALFVRETLETIQAACREAFGLSVSFILGAEAVTWGNIAQKHDELRNLMDCNTLGNEMLMSDKSFSAMENPPAIIGMPAKDIRMKLSRIGDLNDYLQEGQRDKFHKSLEEVTGFLRTPNTVSYNQALEIYFSISLMFISYINRRNLTRLITLKTSLNQLMQVGQHSSWNEVLVYLHKLADILFDVQSESNDDAVSDTISKITQYVNAHLNEDLSLVKLADLVFFNPSYLSRLFKHATGSNLMDFIYKMKADKAKQLLANSNLKIHEVASKVGYDSSTSFARFFKKMTGINPQEYRDSKLTR